MNLTHAHHKCMELFAPVRLAPGCSGVLHQCRPPDLDPLFVDLRKDGVAIIKELVRRASGNLRLAGNHLHGDVADTFALGERLGGGKDLLPGAERSLLARDSSASWNPVAEREGIRGQLLPSLHHDLPFGHAR